MKIGKNKTKQSPDTMDDYAHQTYKIMNNKTKLMSFRVSFILEVEESEKGDGDKKSVSCAHLVHLIKSEASVGLRPDSPERNFTIW